MPQPHNAPQQQPLPWIAPTRDEPSRDGAYQRQRMGVVADV
ncbi:MAG: hypothetical protein WA130_03910 [Candidatus Methanoperedens sp.]